MRQSGHAQPGLFDEGERLKQQGINAVIASNAKWFTKAFVAFAGYAKTHRRQIVTGEHVRFIVLDALGHVQPHHSNIWGALIRELEREGYLRRTGKWEQMKDPRSHKRLTPTYRIAAA